MNDESSWQDDFDEQFPGMLSEATDDGGYNARPYIKSFIRFLLDKQREELREWAQGEINKNVFITTSDIGYNQALEDLLTKLEKQS